MIIKSNLLATKVAPCAWCGYKAKHHERRLMACYGCGSEPTTWFVSCPMCDAQGPATPMDTLNDDDEAAVKRAQAKAVELWNRGPCGKVPRLVFMLPPDEPAS